MQQQEWVYLKHPDTGNKLLTLSHRCPFPGAAVTPWTWFSYKPRRGLQGSLSICNFKADKCYANSNFATLLLCIISCQLVLYIEGKHHWIYFLKKNKIKFTVLPGLEFVYEHRSRLALLQWGWQKKNLLQLNMSQECSQQVRASSEHGLGLLGPVKRWWFNNRLSNRR